MEHVLVFFLLLLCFRGIEFASRFKGVIEKVFDKFGPIERIDRIKKSAFVQFFETRGMPEWPT